jgi:putative ABC transport system ATP-binding protein
MLLLGNSGIGKLTLLHLLCGMFRPEVGTLRVAGRDLRAASDRELDVWRGSELGIVF